MLLLRIAGCTLIFSGMGIIWFGVGVWIAPIGIAMGFGYLYLDAMLRENRKEKKMKTYTETRVSSTVIRRRPVRSIVIRRRPKLIKEETDEKDK